MRNARENEGPKYENIPELVMPKRSRSKISCYILDTNAVLILLQDEPGATAVQRLISRAKSNNCRLIMSIISLGEMYYIIYERRGRIDATKALTYIESLPIEMLTAKRKVTLQAAEIKATKNLGYADSFVVACALTEDGRVVTGDPDFKKADDIIHIRWLIGRAS